MKDIFYQIMYGNLYYRYFIRDMVLKYFKNTDCLSNDVINGGSPPAEQGAVIEFLASEGMIIIERHGIRIT